MWRSSLAFEVLFELWLGVERYCQVLWGMWSGRVKFEARLDDSPIELTLEPERLVVGREVIEYIDLDEVVFDDYSAILVTPDHQLRITHLGKRRDEFRLKLRELRLPARRAAMLQWVSSTPIDSFQAKRGDLEVQVSIFDSGICVEPDSGIPLFMPLSLLKSVERRGYEIDLVAREGLDPLTLRHFGRRTDEFLLDLERARNELAARTSEAYGALSPALSNFTAPDGWAVDATEAGEFWSSLREAFAGQERERELKILETLSDSLRLGLKVWSNEVMPFALAVTGARIAVEGASDEARATFVFACENSTQLNAALLLTNFRREALYLPQDQLGRWAVAVRMLEVVRWARDRLVARIPHDAQWEQKLISALR